jgi:hypothetical protein
LAVNVNLSKRYPVKDSAAEGAMEAAGSNAENFMPDRYHSQEVWDWLSSLPQERLLELLAVHVASSVDASANHAGTLRAAQALDVRKWFTPDAENYFGKVSKDQILADLAEMGVTGDEIKACGSMKKGELAKAAAKVASERTGDWLPIPMLPVEHVETADEGYYLEEIEDFEEAA